MQYWSELMISFESISPLYSTMSSVLVCKRKNGNQAEIEGENVGHNW